MAASFVRSFDEVGDLPDDWGMFSYANLNFAAGKAFLEYEYRVGPYATDEQDGRGGWKMGWKTQGRKRLTLPIEWFYSYQVTVMPPYMCGQGVGSRLRGNDGFTARSK